MLACLSFHRDSVTFVTLELDHADLIFGGTLKRAKAARQELLWALADADEVVKRKGCCWKLTRIFDPHRC